MSSLGRLGTADEVAPAALFLTSDEASYVSGHILAVAGGHVAALTVCSLDSALARSLDPPVFCVPLTAVHVKVGQEPATRSDSPWPNATQTEDIAWARVSIEIPRRTDRRGRRIAERIVDTRKSLEGPYSVWMHAPEWAERVAHLGTLVRWEGTLELRLRTLAALVVGRHFQAKYVWGIQGVIGAERNIPRSTIDAIRDDHSDRIPPDDLQIIDFTRQLLRKNRIDEPLAQAVMKWPGADQYVQLTTCIGYYAMLAMTVNAVELPPNPKHEALKV